MKYILILALLFSSVAAGDQPHYLLRPFTERPDVVQIVNNTQYYMYCWISSNYYYFELELAPYETSRPYSMGEANFITYNCEVI